MHNRTLSSPNPHCTWAGQQRHRPRFRSRISTLTRMASSPERPGVEAFKSLGSGRQDFFSSYQYLRTVSLHTLSVCMGVSSNQACTHRHLLVYMRLPDEHVEDSSAHASPRSLPLPRPKAGSLLLRSQRLRLGCMRSQGISREARNIAASGFQGVMPVRSELLLSAPAQQSSVCVKAVRIEVVKVSAFGNVFHGEQRLLTVRIPIRRSPRTFSFVVMSREA